MMYNFQCHFRNSNLGMIFFYCAFTVKVGKCWFILREWWGLKREVAAAKCQPETRTPNHKTPCSTPNAELHHLFQYLLLSLVSLRDWLLKLILWHTSYELPCYYFAGIDHRKYVHSCLKLTLLSHQKWLNSSWHQCIF